MINTGNWGGLVRCMTFGRSGTVRGGKCSIPHMAVCEGFKVGINGEHSILSF